MTFYYYAWSVAAFFSAPGFPDTCAYANKFRPSHSYANSEMATLALVVTRSTSLLALLILAGALSLSTLYQDNQVSAAV